MPVVRSPYSLMRLGSKLSKTVPQDPPHCGPQLPNKRQTMSASKKTTAIVQTITPPILPLKPLPWRDHLPLSSFPAHLLLSSWFELGGSDRGHATDIKDVDGPILIFEEATRRNLMGEIVASNMIVANPRAAQAVSHGATLTAMGRIRPTPPAISVMPINRARPRVISDRPFFSVAALYFC